VRDNHRPGTTVFSGSIAAGLKILGTTTVRHGADALNGHQHPGLFDGSRTGRIRFQCRLDDALKLPSPHPANSSLGATVLNWNPLRENLSAALFRSVHKT